MSVLDPALTVGIEEEYLLIDPRTGDLVSDPDPAVTDALAGLTAGEIVDFTPRFYMIDGEGAICVYADDIAYHDAGLLNAEGPRHRLYLREGGWDYIRD